MFHLFSCLFLGPHFSFTNLILVMAVQERTSRLLEKDSPWQMVLVIYPPLEKRLKVCFQRAL